MGAACSPQLCELILRSPCRNLQLRLRAGVASARAFEAPRTLPSAGPLTFRSVFAPFSPLCHASRRRAYPFGHPLAHALYRLPAMRPARALCRDKALRAARRRQADPTCWWHSPIAPRRARPASTIAARRFTRGLLLISAARLKALRGPGESYSDVILRVARG